MDDNDVLSVGEQRNEFSGEDSSDGGLEDASSLPEDSDEHESPSPREITVEPEEEAEDIQETIENKPLEKDMVAEGISMLCKTGNGMQLAYVKLDIQGRNITDVSILRTYVHLRFVNLSSNKIRDLSPLSKLTHLLLLRVDVNLLDSAALVEYPYLQVLSFAENRISSVAGIRHTLLQRLCLNGNRIKQVQFSDPRCLGRLLDLELRGNLITTTRGCDELGNLQKLYLARNHIESLDGLDRLIHLSTLHLRDNRLSRLDGFSDRLGRLQYLNLRGNNIDSLIEIAKLQPLPLLRVLVLQGNPITEIDEYRLEVLILIRRLERLDKDPVSEEERQEAEELYTQRREEVVTQGISA